MDSIITNKNHIIDTLVDIYQKSFGDTTANLYKEFYIDKDIQTIMTSAKELLEESMGPAKTQEIFNQIKQQYKEVEVTL